MSHLSFDTRLRSPLRGAVVCPPLMLAHCRLEGEMVCFWAEASLEKDGQICTERRGFSNGLAGYLPEPFGLALHRNDENMMVERGKRGEQVLSLARKIDTGFPQVSLRFSGFLSCLLFVSLISSLIALDWRSWVVSSSLPAGNNRSGL